MSPRFSTVVLLAGLLPVLPAPFARGAGGLAGSIDGDTYTSAHGVFSLKIPVLPELGGTITDAENLVTFEDDYSSHLSIAAFPLDASQLREDSTRGRKDYLVYFFKTFVLPDFQRSYPDTSIEGAARFLPTLNDGALLAYLLIPGGSMFADRARFGTGAPQNAVAKRGNLLFVKSGYIFVLSSELAERVLEGSAYNKTTEEENEILRQRLLNLADKMVISPPAPPPPDPIASSSPAP